MRIRLGRRGAARVENPFDGAARAEEPRSVVRAGESNEARRAVALLERMDLIPGWPLPRIDFVVLGVAYFFVFYDITDIGFGMPAIADQ